MGSLSILHILMLTLLFTTTLHSTNAVTPPTRSAQSLQPQTHTRNLTADSIISGTGGHHLPAGGTEYRHIVSDSLRVVSPFQLCGSCNCCVADDPSNCSWMPCCFGIDCDLPGKPFGLCSFVPKYCNCTSCA